MPASGGVGVRVEQLVAREAAYQQPALDAPDIGMRQAELAADAAISRFGANAVRRARLSGR